MVFDPPQMDATCGSEYLLAFCGQRDKAAATIRATRASLDKSVPFESIDQSGRTAPAQPEAVGEIRRAHRGSFGLRKDEEDLVPFER